VTTSGPAHDTLFQAEVRAGNARGVGRGSTKKDAEQRAAEVAYAALTSEAQRPESDHAVEVKS
jgi:dsRNA-specific ribonuclease